MTNLEPMIGVMILGEVWTAWCLYGIAVCLGVLLVFIQDRHARNWMGAITMFLVLIATALLWHYMSDGRAQAVERIIRAAYMHPEMYGARP
jgi:hypothetical protein